MKSARHLQRLKSLNQVAKRGSPGERVMSAIFPSRGTGFGYWSGNRLEQVQHFRNWTYVAIDAIACKLASIFPNIALVVQNDQPGVTVKAGQRALRNLMGRGFGGDYTVGQHLEKSYATPTGGDYRDPSSWENAKATTVNGNYVGTDGFTQPTVYTRDGQLIQDGNPSPAGLGFSDGGHAFMTMGEYRSKSLGGVVKPHENLLAVESDHPLMRLMMNPNPVDTYFDIEYEKYMFRGLTGVSYEWTPKNRFGKPCERWCIPSHWVYPRTSGGQFVPFYDQFRHNMIWDYEIRPYGYPGYAGVLHFPPDEVIVQRSKNPLSKIDGWAKTAAGAQWIDEEEGISQSRWSQMVNQARPELLIELGEGYEDPDADTIARIEAKFLQRVQGALNYSKPLIAPPGAKATPLSFNPTEMAYFQSEEQVRDMILSLYRVPGAAVGLAKDLTYGALMACLGSMCVFALNPELGSSAQTYTKHLASQFDEQAPAFSTMTGGGYGSGATVNRMRLWFDDCVPADPQQVNSDIAEDRAQFAITPNEVRALRGRAPYKRGGDDPITQGPGGATPLPLNTGDSLADLAALIEPMSKPQQEAQATEALAAQGLDESGKPNLPEEPETEGPANQLSADDHGATGMEPPEEINGEPSKKAWRSGKSAISLPWYITKRDGPHKFSCVMVELDHDDMAQQDIRAMIDRIADADLAADGKEDVLHITVKYGLHTDDAGKVRYLVEKYGPIKIKLGSTSLFESPEYDVVKIDVESDDLRYLHKMLTQLLPNTDKHPEYHPHLTLAYVKPGEGKKYVGWDDVSGNEFEFSGVAFSVPDGNKTFIETSSYAFAEKRRGLGRIGRRKSWDSMEDGGKFPRPAEEVPEVMDKEGWVTTESGTHIFLDNAGTVTAGPAAMTGKPVSRLGSGGSKPSDSGGEKPAKPSSGDNNSASAKVVASKADAKTYVTESHGGWGKGLPESQREALQNYSEDTFSDINDNLRGGGSGGHHEEAVEELDAAIASAPPLTEPLTVYRGVGKGVLPKLKVGATFKDKGFMSTAMVKDSTSEFSGEVLMEIRLPKGTKVAAMDTVKGVYGGETEMLLPRGSQLQIKSMNKVNGKMRVVAEYVNG